MIESKRGFAPVSEDRSRALVPEVSPRRLQDDAEADTDTNAKNRRCRPASESELMWKEARERKVERETGEGKGSAKGRKKRYEDNVRNVL